MSETTARYYFGVFGWWMGHISNDWWGLAGLIVGFAFYDVAIWVWEHLPFR